MNTLFLLLPLSVVILVIAIIGFFWAISSGQYEDLDRHAKDILLDDAKDNCRSPSKTDKKRTL